jgi:hypothetical protein
MVFSVSLKCGYLKKRKKKKEEEEKKKKMCFLEGSKLKRKSSQKISSERTVVELKAIFFQYPIPMDGCL